MHWNRLQVVRQTQPFPQCTIDSALCFSVREKGTFCWCQDGMTCEAFFFFSESRCNFLPSLIPTFHATFFCAQGEKEKAADLALAVSLFVPCPLSLKIKSRLLFHAHLLTGPGFVRKAKGMKGNKVSRAFWEIWTPFSFLGGSLTFFSRWPASSLCALGDRLSEISFLSLFFSVSPSYVMCVLNSIVFFALEWAQFPHKR